jgi:phosphoribosylformylglycinamidine synthase
LVSSAHDCAEGGLAVALAEAVIEADAKLGATVTSYPAAVKRPDFALFGESQSRVVVSCKLSDLDAIKRLAKGLAVPVHEIGRVTADSTLTIGREIRLGADALRKAYRSAIPEAVGEMTRD